MYWGTIKAPCVFMRGGGVNINAVLVEDRGKPLRNHLPRISDLGLFISFLPLLCFPFLPPPPPLFVSKQSLVETWTHQFG